MVRVGKINPLFLKRENSLAHETTFVNCNFTKNAATVVSPFICVHYCINGTNDFCAFGYSEGFGWTEEYVSVTLRLH